MSLSAYDYVTKPFDTRDLVLRVRRALERQTLMHEIEVLRSEVERGGALAQRWGSRVAVLEAGPRGRLPRRSAPGSR